MANEYFPTEQSVSQGQNLNPQNQDIDQLMTTLRDQGVEYVRFELPDLHGVSRLKLVPVNKVEGYARKGLNFYGGTLGLDTASQVVPNSGLHAERKYRDQMLIPDLTTLTPVPWLERTVKVICDPQWHPQEPLTIAPRYVLKSLLAKATALGFDVMMGHEFEFYLLKQKTYEPLFDGLHIFNHIRNQYVPEIDQLLAYLQAAGIDLITHNCEYAPSQLEINFGPAVGIKAADKAFTFKNAVKEIAHRLGLHATFMTKPFSNQAGSCCHLHMSLIDRSTGNNAFLDLQQPEGMSQTFQAFIQGILTHAPAMMPLIGPTPNCYRRLKPQSFAPSNISWGIEDRTAMVRVKATGDSDTHLEMRAGSGLSNPYLIAAATLAAGLLGIQHQYELQPMGDGPGETNLDLPRLPTNLEMALDCLNRDTAMRSLLGEDFVQLFTTVKQYELARFHAHVTDWERQEYLDVY